MVSTLQVIDYLNLAQNYFTEKILQVLLSFSSRGTIGKGKTVQLGQNKINSRRLKERIDELKEQGLIKFDSMSDAGFDVLLDNLKILGL